jgi:hypothetical protein
MKAWVIFVDSNFQARIGHRFPVQTSDEDTIADLNDKVKEKCPETLSRAHADASTLTVWRIKHKMIFNESTFLEDIQRGDALRDCKGFEKPLG